jgi:Fuc2NAc and GlcNAc transferase
MIDHLAVLLVSAVTALLLTAWARHAAMRNGMLDIPNHRSSHSVPVPRGGGVAIVATFGAGILLLAGAGSLDISLLLALVPGGAAIALVGWLDDRGGVPPRVRALVHFAAAASAVAWLGGLPTLRLGTMEFGLGLAGPALAVVGMVWFLNLFNFMDGIDGIASSQAVMISGVAGAIALLNGDPAIAAAYALVCGASGGFMIWNWPPARIFMGDVGSGFLGFILAVLAVAGERAGSVPLAVWIVLVALFGFDATVTLVRRLLRRERVYEAHRSHAYQRAVISGLSHRDVTMAAAVITLLLGAAALLAAFRPAVLGVVMLGAAALLSAVYLAVERRRPMY